MALSPCLKNLTRTSLLSRSRTQVLSVLLLSLSVVFLFSTYHSPVTTATTFASRLLSASNSVASPLSYLVASAKTKAPRGGDHTLSSVAAVERTTGNSRRTAANSISDLTSCDIFDGKWVADDDIDPPYQPGSCQFVDGPFNCFKNGRSDSDYLRYRWKPHGCEIPRFDGKQMLEMLRGKRVVFVGDSLNRNMWESLVCALRESLEDKNRVSEASARREFRTHGFYSFTFRDYQCSIDFVKSPFLVQEWKVSDRRETLRLDMIQGSFSNYQDADIIIFNTGHWWTHQKTYKGKGFFQEGDHVYRTLEVSEAYRKALRTWAQWVDANIDSNKTRVFFAGYSASHFKGGQWNSGGSCDGETRPITNESYLGAYPWMMKILESVIAEMRTPVFYLNITRMTDYRKDGHPSIYRQPPETASGSSSSMFQFQDCSHWCLPGVPDSWNQLLYATLLISHHHLPLNH